MNRERIGLLLSQAFEGFARYNSIEGYPQFATHYNIPQSLQEKGIKGRTDVISLMKPHFEGYYPLSEAQLKAAWKQAVIILDANVLLDLYRLPETTRGKLLGVFQAVQERLWIPHQVALEYQENRLRVIDEQVSTFYQVEKVLEGVKNKLRSELDKLQLQKRHSRIDPESFLQDIDARINEFMTELAELRKLQPSVEIHDELRDRIDVLLDGRVGQPPQSQDELELIYQEGATRYARWQPPGYSDQVKEKSPGKSGTAYLYRGLVIERQYGDLILWKEIIKEAQSRVDWKHIIFVTNDSKDDWWWKTKKSKSGYSEEEIIGPRPELVAEILAETSISTFAMYQHDTFLRAANQFLGLNVSEEAVQQVQDIVRVARARESSELTITRRHFPITDKVFSYDGSPQKILVRFSNQSESMLRVHKVLYSDTGLGLPTGALRDYLRDDRRRMVVYSSIDGTTVVPGEDYYVELELKAKWDLADINRWSGDWGYLRLLVTLEDDPEEEIELFYSI